MIIDTVAFEFFVLERQRGLAGCPQINRGIGFVRDDFGENSADLQAGRIFARRSVIAFDCLVDAFEAANLECHFARKFFQDILEVLEIAADKKLRLFGGDIERLIHRVDGVGDLLHCRLKA